LEGGDGTTMDRRSDFQNILAEKMTKNLEILTLNTATFCENLSLTLFIFLEKR
jgi:hypothetical protein